MWKISGDYYLSKNSYKNIITECHMTQLISLFLPIIENKICVAKLASEYD